jgi:multidrug efflux system outer membrane protein
MNDRNPRLQIAGSGFLPRLAGAATGRVDDARNAAWPRRLNVRLFAAAFFFCGALAGCEVGPNYTPLHTRVSSRWNAPQPVPTTQSTVLPTTQRSVTVEEPLAVAQWWTAFNDPELNSLIERGVQANLDVRAAQYRIVQARAQRGATASQLFPGATAVGTYSRDHSEGARTNNHFDSSFDYWQAGLDATWELDIFGGVRRSVESADASIGFAIEDRRDVLVTLLSEVALNYIQLRGFQQEIIIARDNLQSQEHTAAVTRRKQLGGFVAALDVANAEADVASTASSLPVLESAEEQSIYAISVLLAQEPDALASELETDKPIPTTPPEIPIGLPSDLLKRRPDIRRAERNLAAATANIGAVTAQLFPNFSLVGSLGLQNSQFQPLFNASSRYWSIGPSISWPIFDAGRIRANIDAQNSLQMQALVAYQKAVLTALQDVKNSLVAYAKEQVHRKALSDAVIANRRAVDISTRLYSVGSTDFLNVLTAERSLFASEDQLVQSESAVSTDLVALYKALGGGWEIGESAPPAH